MASTWRLLERALLSEDDADKLGKLLRYMAYRYNDHEADKLRGIITRANQAKKPQAKDDDDIPHQPGYGNIDVGDLKNKFKGTPQKPQSAPQKEVDPWDVFDKIGQQLANDYGDKKLNHLYSQLAPTTPRKGSSRSNVSADDALAMSTDKGSGQSEPIPDRPDRAGTRPPVDPMKRGSIDPKDKKFQAVGSAGQNQAQPQPSIHGGTTTTRGQQMTVANPIPKTKEAEELEKVRAALKKLPPPAVQNDQQKAQANQMLSRIAALTKAGVSTIKGATGMSPDQFYKQDGHPGPVGSGGTEKANPMPPMHDVDELGPDGKPTGKKIRAIRPGTRIGEPWMPPAFSKPTKNDKEGDEMGEAEAALKRAEASGNREEIMMAKARVAVMHRRRAGGFSKKPVAYGSQATGNDQKGAVNQNPAKPGNITGHDRASAVDPRTGQKVNTVVKTKWSDDHGLYWSGDAKHTPPERGGWATKAEMDDLIKTGKLRPKKKTASESLCRIAMVRASRSYR